MTSERRKEGNSTMEAHLPVRHSILEAKHYDINRIEKCTERETGQIEMRTTRGEDRKRKHGFSDERIRGSACTAETFRHPQQHDMIMKKTKRWFKGLGREAMGETAKECVPVGPKV